MKEVERKDVPEVSGGLTVSEIGWLPIVPQPPQFPPDPGGPTDPPDPLGDAIPNNQVQS